MGVTNNIKQLLISGVLGDGCPNYSGQTSFNCMHKEYMLFKKSLAPENTSEVKSKLNMGFKKGSPIYTLSLKVTKEGKEINNSDIEDVVKGIDELGLAMWLYDDGSLHKKNFFYNINTHSFPKEVQEKVLIPLLNKFNIFPRILEENKKDGRKFHYLYVPKYEGTFEISKILSKYPLECYKYKKLPEHIVERYIKVKEKFSGYKVKKVTLTRVIEGDETSFKNYINNVMFVDKQGFVSINKQSRYVDNKDTIIL